ncbi:ubiquinol-cytochrome-c reductase complex assembly factor 1-like [Dendronephthya gigantea]|uniref:ubiquinol-cytochrome-c reductase complex assembly factor 1-like n=1 Tax=Dendronephthya gigantea TaxID=151771 RepID=UPI00106D4AB1|nr:ubiquinol-cytochrome-c reductase complex assembly factor 1-like [Dendronephthya gigantea]
MSVIQRVSRQIIRLQPSSLRAMCIPFHSRLWNGLNPSPTIGTAYVVSRSFSEIPSNTSIENEDNLGNKVLKLVGWLGGFYSRKAVLTRSAKVMYECCVEGLDYEKFYEAAGMPDTFQSWFLINQLHVWMCLVRLKPEGKDGRYMYRRMVQIFWEDVEERMKVMGVVDPSVRKQSLKDLMQEFYGLILAYDEGLLSHDRVLAASIWRNMFHNKKNTDASNLANFVEYVRKQVLHLESIDSEKLFITGEIEWLPFEGHVCEK